MSYIVQSDSILANTAAELLARHAAGAANGMCRACGSPAPCPAARHADSVLAAVPAMERVAEAA
ncbi:hypothetical protein ABT369_32630 [Dactylosporangium sp. NPDC000244]|uniref:hypothetical protein n=1 Tax=Dactylosporangium sp. NPDC000244 TaxID=3154365 RepID=UPI003326BF77